jgi:hypothetical protein
MIILAALLVGPAALSAEVLTSWNFDGGVSGSNGTPSETDPLLISNDVTRGAGLATAGGTGKQEDAWEGIRDYTAESLSAALTAEDYLTFTVEPVTGATVDLSQFTISLRLREGQNETASFAMFDEAGTQVGATQSTTLGEPVYALYTIDMSSAPTISTSTSFRLAFITSDQGAYNVTYIGSTDEGINDIAFEGTAVPEPATMALLGLGAVVGIRRRRR